MQIHNPGLVKEDFILKIIAVIIELAAVVCVLWVISFLSTLVHELGHAARLYACNGKQELAYTGWMGKTAYEFQSRCSFQANLR